MGGMTATYTVRAFTMWTGSAQVDLPPFEVQAATKAEAEEAAMHHPSLAGLRTVGFRSVKRGRLQ